MNRGDELPGHMEIATIVSIADKFARSVHAIESLVGERGEVRILKQGPWWLVRWVDNERLYTVIGKSLPDALQSAQGKMRGDPMAEKMTVGGAKLGKCVQCGQRAQLTANGFCDECCPSGDCPAPSAKAASVPPEPKSPWWKFWRRS